MIAQKEMIAAMIWLLVRTEVRLLHGILHLALVHEGNLKIEIDPTDDQEKDENDVSDGRVKVAAYFT